MKKTIFRTTLLTLAMILLIITTGCTTNAYLTLKGGKSTVASMENVLDPNVLSNPLEQDDGTLKDELIAELTEYLKWLFGYIDPFPMSFSQRIDTVKEGRQAVHVSFEPSNYYFACAYHNRELTTGSVYIGYSDADEYTWVRFDSEKDICKSYEDKEFIVAFQINKPSLCEDISISEKDVPYLEHFQLYKTNFENGFNTNPPIEFEQTFVYLNDSEQTNIYHSKDVVYNEYVTFPCVKMDGRYYVTQVLYAVSSDGERHDRDVEWEFGDYYDVLWEIMETGKYTTTNEKGVTYYYGLMELDTFMDTVIKFVPPNIDDSLVQP